MRKGRGKNRTVQYTHIVFNSTKADQLLESSLASIKFKVQEHMFQRGKIRIR